MKITHQKLNVAVVLPVFSDNTAYLSVINTNCKALLKAMPEVNWKIIIINDGSSIVPDESQLVKYLTADINCYYYHFQNNIATWLNTFHYFIFEELCKLCT